MGMFDEVYAVNIAHKNFDTHHNRHSFQTKDLDCNMSEYCIFNGALYQEVDNSGEYKRHENAVLMDYSGSLNIYTPVKSLNVEYWVEYELTFDSGRLVDVVAHEPTVMQDYRDISASRPSKPSNRVEVTISVSSCDSAKQDAFAESIDDQKLEAIRDILGEPKATILFPAKPAFSGGIFGMTRPRIINIASVVQTMDDFQASSDGKVKVKAPNGDQICILQDELPGSNSE